MNVSPRALLRSAVTALIIVIVGIAWLSILLPRYWLFDLDAPPTRPELQQRSVRDGT